LIEEIDKIVGVKDKQKVTTGEAVMAMVINGLGFINRPLYLTPEFMKNKPMELFFRGDLKPGDFNKKGRTHSQRSPRKSGTALPRMLNDIIVPLTQS